MPQRDPFFVEKWLICDVLSSQAFKNADEWVGRLAGTASFTLLLSKKNALSPEEIVEDHLEHSFQHGKDSPLCNTTTENAKKFRWDDTGEVCGPWSEGMVTIGRIFTAISATNVCKCKEVLRLQRSPCTLQLRQYPFNFNILPSTSTFFNVFNVNIISTSPLLLQIQHCLLPSTAT
jgi:hypothetical protein